MDDSKTRQPKWRALADATERINDKSMYSRDSSKHSKYTPSKRSIGSPKKVLNLHVLQGAGSQKGLEDSNVDRYSERNSLVDRSRPRKYNSISQENRDSLLHSQINNATSSVIIIPQGGPQQPGANRSELHENKSLKNINISINDDLNVLKRQLNQNQQQAKLDVVNLQHRLDILDLNGGNIQSVFGRCVRELAAVEQKLSAERSQIHRILEEKFKNFIEIKQQFYRVFATKEKHIHSNELRTQLLRYVPKEEKKQTLGRVTSERVFSRFASINSDNAAVPPSIEKLDTDRSDVGRGEKLQDYKSVRSRVSSTCKERFGVLFEAIDKLKKGIAENETLLAVRAGESSKQELRPVKKAERFSLNTLLTSSKDLGKSKQQRSLQKKRPNRLLRQSKILGR